MGYYASKTDKIVHTGACRYVHMIPESKKCISSILSKRLMKDMYAVNIAARCVSI